MTLGRHFLFLLLSKIAHNLMGLLNYLLKLSAINYKKRKGYPYLSGINNTSSYLYKCSYSCLWFDISLVKLYN